MAMGWSKKSESYVRTSVGIFACAFGLMTIKEGGGVLIGGVEACQVVQCVPFVTWFNFLAGFAYITAGVAFLKSWSWFERLAKYIALSTVLVFLGFGLHVFKGGEFATRTVLAMSLRSIFWVGFAFLALQLQENHRSVV